MNMVENPKEAAGRKKLQLQLCPPAAKREMALALEHGAKKYGAWNWREAGIVLETYIGAIQRHLDAIQDGEDVDPDSGLSHWAHVLAGAAVVVDATGVGMLTDDRPFARRQMKDLAEEDWSKNEDLPELRVRERVFTKKRRLGEPIRTNCVGDKSKIGEVRRTDMSPR